ncbi:MAG: hypothetical protein ACRDMV_25310 [Streptosporangiales bacterium]
MADQQPDPQLVALIAAYGVQVADIRQRIENVVVRLWRALGSYRDADARRFAETITPMILAGQVQIEHLTESYLTQYVARILAEARHVGRAAQLGPLDYSDLRKSTDPADVYRRPFQQVWTELSHDVPYPDAVDRGERRAKDLAATDLQLAKTHKSRQVMETMPDQVVGYRRVLEGDYSCGLCVVASTQRYHKGKLLPIHPECDCGIAPIVGTNDPGQVIDEDRLVRAHDEIMKRLGVSDAGARNPDYRKLLIEHTHGEIGPVLAVRGQSFTGPSDVE